MAWRFPDAIGLSLLADGFLSGAETSFSASACKAAKVINMSWGLYAHSQILRNPLIDALMKSVLVAAARKDGICIGPGRLLSPPGSGGPSSLYYPRRDGASRPSFSCSSPDANISLTMSEPPMSSPCT